MGAASNPKFGADEEGLLTTFLFASENCLKRNRHADARYYGVDSGENF
jgi:hypothetical protein